MTGLRVPAGPGPAVAGPAGTGDSGAGPRSSGRGAARRGGRPLAALGLAAADLDAHRAGAAVPARAGQHSRLGAAAGGHRPGGGQPVLHGASRAGPGAGQVLAVQRVRSALVRGDLPAAVRLAGRLRAAPDVPPGRVGPAAAAAGAAQHLPAAAVGALPDRPGARRGGRRRAAAARRPPVPAARRAGWVAAEKGYLREVGQPAVPHRAARTARLGRPRRPVRVQGEPAAGGRARSSRTRRPRWTSSALAAWSPPPTCSRSRWRCRTSARST